MIEETVSRCVAEPWTLLVGLVIAGAVFLIGTTGR